MPVLICLREKLWTRTYSIRDQVPTRPVFTRAKIKSCFGILVDLLSQHTHTHTQTHTRTHIYTHDYFINRTIAIFLCINACFFIDINLFCLSPCFECSFYPRRFISFTHWLPSFTTFFHVSILSFTETLNINFINIKFWGTKHNYQITCRPTIITCRNVDVEKIKK